LSLGLFNWKRQSPNIWDVACRDTKHCCHVHACHWWKTLFFLVELTIVEKTLSYKML
jgi:hypothetical protein